LDNCIESEDICVASLDDDDCAISDYCESGQLTCILTK
jgi:hypothetical protein